MSSNQVERESPWTLVRQGLRYEWDAASRSHREMIISLSVSKMQTCEAHSEERWCAVRWATLESTKMPNADIWGVARRAEVAERRNQLARDFRVAENQLLVGKTAVCVIVGRGQSRSRRLVELDILSDDESSSHERLNLNRIVF